jgi:hypothetical protein
MRVPQCCTSAPVQNCALETIERARFAVHHNLKSLVIVVAASFACRYPPARCKRSRVRRTNGPEVTASPPYIDIPTLRTRRVWDGSRTASQAEADEQLLPRNGARIRLVARIDAFTLRIQLVLCLTPKLFGLPSGRPAFSQSWWAQLRICAPGYSLMGFSVRSTVPPRAV